MSAVTYPYVDRRWIGQDEAVKWLSELGRYTHFITITLKRNIKGRPERIRRAAEDTLKAYLLILSRRCLKNAFKRGERSLSYIAAYHSKFTPNNPHIHLAIGMPDTETYDSFTKILENQHEKMRSFDIIFQVKPYTSAGGIDYIIREEQDSIIIDCISEGK
jgi:hypothetical protein